MGIIDQISEMQAQGLPDDQIVRTLQEQGISPKEINDAINQVQIKNAVSSEDVSNSPPAPNQQASQEMGEYAPQPGQEQQYYQEDPNYAPSTGGDTETIIEVAEQVFMEKIQKIEKKVDAFSEFKSLSEVKITNLEERLGRIEKIIDKLQISILEKVGSYGKKLDSTKKEMDMMQDSFRKVVGKKKKSKK